MKIYNKKTKIILPILVLIGVIILIIFLQKEIVEKIFLISPFLILWLSYIREKEKEKRRTEKDKVEKQKDIQYFFEKLIEWIEGGEERSSYLENYIIKNTPKYQRIFGISLLKLGDLSPVEQFAYQESQDMTGRSLVFLIFILEGKYIIQYSFEYTEFSIKAYIRFAKPRILDGDSTKIESERIKMEEKAREDMIKDIIEFVRKEHEFELKYKKKKMR